MNPSLSNVFSATLHIALILFLLNSQADIKPLDEGQGLLLELQDGDIPLGESPTPTMEAKQQPLPPKKVVEKPVQKKAEVVALPAKKKIAPPKKEVKAEKIITKLPEKKEPTKKVVTQEDESFAKVVVAEESKPVKQQESAEVSDQGQAVTATALAGAAQEESAPEAVATTLPSKAEKVESSQEPLLPPQKPVAKKSLLVSKESQNNADAFGAPTGIRDARKLKQSPGNRPPEYPVPDRLRRRQGRVTLLAYVTSQGTVQKIQVENARATSLMTNEAVRAFSRYRFSQGQQGWVRMPFEFRLIGPSKNMAARLRQSKTR